MSILNNKARVGRFTSSNIWKLMRPGRKEGSFGAPALEYIEEKKMERRLQRPLQKEVFSRPMSWGNFVEKYVFEKLPLNYVILSNKTTPHPEYGDFWAGSTDLLSDDAVGNIKCPELKAFCKIIDGGADGLIDYKYGEYFWQLISDACINDKRCCELIPYVPYFNELSAIQEQASVSDDEYKWITFADSNELPWIHAGGYYEDLNIIRFDATPYKQQLTERVLEAQKLLEE